VADEGPVWQAHLGEALDRPVAAAFRAVASSGAGPSCVTIEVPEGIAAAWAGDDPSERAGAAVFTVDRDGDGAAELARIEFSGSGGREVFILPTVAIAEAAPGLRVSPLGAEPAGFPPDAIDGPRPGLRVKAGARTVSVDVAIAPQPPARGEAVSGMDEETLEALRSLGYMEGPDEASHEPGGVCSWPADPPTGPASPGG
jgi:hypothetical protein